MIYRSNLLAPDLSPHFKLKQPPLQMLGHDVPSDPDFIPECGFLTHDEAAILFNIAKAWPKRWADIGARFGWSTAHIAVGTPLPVDAVDPENGSQSRAYGRFFENVDKAARNKCFAVSMTSKEYFSHNNFHIDAAMIDGCHDAPEPTLDALRAIQAGASVLVWHDFQGGPVRDAVKSVMARQTSAGFNCWRARVYWTPNLMAVAWREGSGFVPPDHVRDPAIDWSGYERIVADDFDVRRCS